MPYSGDEFFPDASERDELNDAAAHALVPLIALRRVAYALGFDSLGDAAVELERDLAAAIGAELDDVDAIIEDAESRVGEGLDAFSELTNAVEAELARRSAQFQRDIRKLASLRDDLRRTQEPGQ